MTAMVTVPYIRFGATDVAVHDRTADLHAAIVDLGSFGASVHIDDAVTARQLAAAFTRAAGLLDGQPATGGEPGGMVAERSRMPAELAARLTVARDAVAGFSRQRAAFASGGDPVDWLAWSQRLAIALEGLAGAVEGETRP
jgi:hypothetical protein